MIILISPKYANADQDDKALEWAERGLRAFPKMTDSRLRDFLVAAYLQRKRNEEALQLTWVQFEERAILEHYQKLHKVAKQLGLWTEQREWALDWVAEVITRRATATDHWNPKPAIPNFSLRVEIALWEKDLDAAWAAVNAGVCSHDLLIILAGKLETKRGNDAITLYKRVIPLLVEQTNNTAYADALQAQMKFHQAFRWGYVKNSVGSQFRKIVRITKSLKTDAIYTNFWFLHFSKHRV